MAEKSEYPAEKIAEKVDQPIELTTEDVVDNDEFVHEEHQFTWRAAIVGSLLGCVVAASNLYLGLKIGWTFGASLWGAIFGFLILRTISTFTKSVFGPKENVTCQTAATAAGGLSSGFVTAIPALYRMGLMSSIDPMNDIASLFLWTTVAAFFGMFYAIPLRTHFVVNQDLAFPTPRAAAETIKNLHRAGSSAAADARKTGFVMMYSFLTAMCFVLLGFFIPNIFASIHILYYIGAAAGYTKMANADAVWGWAWSWDFSFFGAGLMTPGSTVWSFLLGELIAFGIAGPLMVDSGYLTRPFGFLPPPAVGTAQSWWLWPGIALMVCTAFSELAANGRSLVHGVTSGVRELRNVVRRMAKKESLADNSGYVSKDPAPAHEQIPTLWWSVGLLISGVGSIIVMNVYFHVPVYATIGALLLSFFLAFVGLQASGETDINPTGSVGKVTQLVFSALPGESLAVIQKTNLMCANISASVCAQSVDMVGDLKTGHLVGASPRSQFLAQAVGSVFAIVIAVPLFLLYTSAYPCILDSSLEKCAFAVPAVQAWANVCKILTGDGTIPQASLHLTIACAVLAVANVFGRNKFVPEAWRPYWINLNAVGLGFINPSPAIPVAMCVGWCSGQVWIRLSKATHEKFMYSVSGGFIAGVGIAGIFNCFMTLAGVEEGLVAVGCGDGNFC